VLSSAAVFRRRLGIVRILSLAHSEFFEQAGPGVPPGAGISRHGL
jgi:hypothetical protein